MRRNLFIVHICAILSVLVCAFTWIPGLVLSLVVQTATALWLFKIDTDATEDRILRKVWGDMYEDRKREINER